MAKKQGKCINIDCDNYKQIVEVETGEEFECPLCHQHLEEVGGGGGKKKKTDGGGPNWPLIGGIAAALIVVALLLIWLLSGSSTPEVKNLTLDKESITLKPDLADRLTVTIDPEDAKPELVWSSSAEDVASVQDGVVKASKAGKTTITVSVKDNESIKAQCECIVADGDVDMKTLSINEDPVLLKTGGKQRLTVTFTPEDQTEMILWESSDETIATVSDRGLVEALKPGEVTIMAKSERSGITATSKVTVEGHETTTTVTDKPKTKEKTSEGGSTQQQKGGRRTGTLTLSYGTYSGDINNNKPDGAGQVTFTKSYQLPNGVAAERGDKLKGVFQNGTISMGTLTKKDGQVINVR